MSKLHIANFFDAPRWTVRAGQDLAEGQVIRIVNQGGERTAVAVANGDSALLVAGNYGVAFKVNVDPLGVDTSSAPAAFGDRTLNLNSGDYIVQVDRTGILEYDVSLLHSSLDPNRGGALPVAGTALGVVGSLFCTTGTASAITSPVIGRVFDVLGSKVRVILV
jgi:hypothetical protein